MDDFNWIDFKNFDLPNNIDLNMTVFNVSNNTTEDDFVFLDIIDEDSINLIDSIKLLEELKNKNFVEQCICVNFDFFIKDIKKSFKGEKDIRSQFEVDMPRCNIYLNNHHIDSYNTIVDFLDYRFNNDIVIDIMMLTTQAMLGLPFQILHNSINSNDEYYMAEISSGDADKRSYIISVELTDDNINFKAYKEFRIFRIINGEDVTIYKVYIKIEFSLLHSKEYILLNVKTTKV